MPSFSSVTKLLYGGLIAICLCHCGAKTTHAALLVSEYDRDRHDRFANSSSFIGSDFDWSGVGRTSSGQWGTLISERHFVTASHFAPANNSVLRFYANNDPNGAYAEQTVITRQSIGGSDLALGELSAPVFFGSTFDINYYPLLDLPETSEFAGTELFVVGQSTDPLSANTRIGRNQVQGVISDFSTSGRTGDIFFYNYDTSENGGDEARVSGGDSGGPSFTVTDGQLTLAGVHWFVYGNTASTTGGSGSGDTLISSYIEEIAQSTGRLSSSFLIASVPEPSSMLPLLLLVGFAGMRRKQRTTIGS